MTNSRTDQKKPQGSEFSPLIKTALLDPWIQPSSFRILCLIHEMNLLGQTEIRPQHLSQATGICLRTTYGALQELENRNYIKRIKRPRKPSLIIANLNELIDPDDDDQSNQDDSGLHKLQRRILTKEKIFNSSREIIRRIEAKFRTIQIPGDAYLYARKRLIHQTAHMLKLHYAKVILAIMLADYYKTLNPDYQIVRAGGWIAKIASLPDTEISIPSGFAEFLESRLSEMNEEAESHQSFPFSQAPPAVSSEGPTPPTGAAHSTNAIGGVAYCPRCGEAFPDRFEAIRHHERTCVVRKGPIGALCQRCFRFVVDTDADRAFHRVFCGGQL